MIEHGKEHRLKTIVVKARFSLRDSKKCSLVCRGFNKYICTHKMIFSLYTQFNLLAKWYSVIPPSVNVAPALEDRMTAN